MTESFVVDNVHCPSCIGRIEGGLKALPGVSEARLNLTTKRIAVDWDDSVLSADDIIHRLDSLGHPARPISSATPRERGRDTRDKALLRAMAVAGFAAANIMLLSVSVWSADGGEMGTATRDMLHWISALIALPAVAYAGRPFFSSALTALKTPALNMDVPISLAVMLAAGMSVAQTMMSGEHAYFDAAVMLLFFLLIGRYLDQQARSRARSTAENLLALRSDYATVIGPEGDARRYATEDVVPGMRVLVAAGERFPVDGRVLKGSSTVDTSLITGESLPRPAREGDIVHAGTVNLGTAIEIEATAKDAGTLLAGIVRLMEKALEGRNRYVRLADRAAGIYAPAVHIVAALTFAGWLVLGPGWQVALMNAIAVLIITCPCALGLAVPVVQVVASNTLLKRGILVKSGDALERLAAADTIVFDKTGTLTLGEFEAEYLDLLTDEDLLNAARLAAASRHPLARALLAAARARCGRTIAPAENVEEHAGLGLAGEIDGKPMRLGSALWCGAKSQADDGDPGSELWFRSADAAPTRIRFQDRPRPGARAAIAALKAAGYHVVLLSGDRPAAVAAIGRELGIADWSAALRPDEKIVRLEELRRAGRTVVMVGDGLNDAPALSAAHASISPATGADISQTAADLVFGGQSLAAVPTALHVARIARRLVFENFSLAAGYNLIAVPLAVAGLVTPLIAAVAMSGSSIAVTLNALRLTIMRGAGR